MHAERGSCDWRDAEDWTTTESVLVVVWQSTALLIPPSSGVAYAVGSLYILITVQDDAGRAPRADGAESGKSPVARV